MQLLELHNGTEMNEIAGYYFDNYLATGDDYLKEYKEINKIFRWINGLFVIYYGHNDNRSKQ
jgi:hypothetical protein